MCCNGVLFHSVQLQSDDPTRQLSALGLKIKKKKGQTFFLQPCPAHRESSCAIYEQRPNRCRLFNCRQILQFDAGEITEAAALVKIYEACDLVARINNRISQVAETNPNRGLAQRCASALTTAEKSSVHEELESTMQELESLLEKEFRVKSSSAER